MKILIRGLVRGLIDRIFVHDDSSVLDQPLKNMVILSTFGISISVLSSSYLSISTFLTFSLSYFEQQQQKILL